MAAAESKPIDLDALRVLVRSDSTETTREDTGFRVGDPARWLRFAGILTHDESEEILAAVHELDHDGW